MYLLISLPGVYCYSRMETGESIIADLRRLGVRVNQILSYRPTDQQLKEIRDGMLRLKKKAGSLKS
jgi:hypothetical protein